MLESLSTARTADAAPQEAVQLGLPTAGTSLRPAGIAPPVKPTSEVAHQPGQQPAIAWLASPEGETWARQTFRPAEAGAHLAPMGALLPLPWGQPWRNARYGPWLCGGVQRGEIKSAGQTAGGACGGTRLGDPCNEDGLTR